MKNVTAQELAKLKNKPSVCYYLEFEVGNNYYRYTAGDINEEFDGNTYIAGIVDADSFDDIEITSTPKINDSNITLFDADYSLTTLFLSQPYMNRHCGIYKIIKDEDGNEILTKIVFEGLITDASPDAENNMVELTVSSIWADYEKVAGVRTNPASQQRFEPTDTAFEHTSQADKTIYWGKDAPSSSGGSANSGADITKRPPISQAQ